MELEKGNKDKKNMKDSMLMCCKMFISESRNQMALDSIERALRLDPETVMVNCFKDLEYNRVRYTLVSYVVHDKGIERIYSPLQQSVLAMVEAAYQSINLELHSGAHPRFGVVDHICFHPLARASTEEASQLAKSTAASIGNILQVPVFLFEAAHPNGRALDSIRRELGYYRPNFMGSQWAGWSLPEVLSAAPDEGPMKLDCAKGIVAIGASPWIETYNVPVLSTNVTVTRRIARLVSERGGGLAKVQSLGLVHGEETTEIACNLLDPKRIGAERVQKRIEIIAAKEGVEVEKGYFTDFSQEMILDKYMELISKK